MPTIRRLPEALINRIESLLGGESTAPNWAELVRQPVEIDARHVTFMDSSGVALLARGAMPAESRRGLPGAGPADQGLEQQVHLVLGQAGTALVQMGLDPVAVQRLGLVVDELEQTQHDVGAGSACRTVLGTHTHGCTALAATKPRSTA